MKNVVVIDDEKHVREGIVNETDWSSVDCRVVGEAANGSEGYELVLRQKPDLIICDVRMPGMDGLAMVSELRKANVTAKVIFLTAYSDFSYVQKALRLGAVDYILKPFADGQLESTIRRLAREEILESRAGNGQDSGPADPDDQILPLRGEDPSMNRYVRSAIRFIREHYREEGVSISTVAAGIGVSEGHLSRLFKKDTGMSVSTYVTTFRIRKAMRLLRSLQYRVSEAAAMVGYQDLAYFSSTFRKLTGMSPSEFQERAG